MRSQILNKNFWRGYQLPGAAAAVLMLTFLSIPAFAQRTDLGWPRTIQSDNEQIQVYQPQVDKWEGGQLEARAATVITRQDQAQPIYGALWISARTTLDQDQRLVTLYDIDVTRAVFPSAGDEKSSYVASATRAVSQWTFTIGLDRLLADLAITQNEAKAKGEALGTNPPKIYVRQNPTVLILIDGQPTLQKVKGTNLMRVINTPAVIVLDPATGQYFLQGDGYWMTAPNLNAAWTKAINPPGSLATVLQQEADNNADNTATVAPAGAPPEVIVSTEPAELIQLKGEAQFSPISGTKLLYVTNTDGDLFMSVPEQRYYVLLSGRWFRAQSFDGPWEFVRGSALPQDFARIPAGHPKAAVLASVPGTPQAWEAVVAAQVPQTATVNRKQVKFTATYDGDPQFKPIEGTDMSYAVNSPDDIILVGGRYYAVNDGVWFVADNPLGPWAVCDMVPPDIYSIPPSSPLYHVRYVYVYDATPDFVYVGYTPGYFGAFIWDGVVVYGTGFGYPCWASDFWYPCPWTWGFGWHYVYWGWGYHWRPWYPSRWYWHRWRDRDRDFPRWTHRVMYNRPVMRTPRDVRLRNTSAYDRWSGPGVISRHPVPLRPPAKGVAPPRPVARPPVTTRRDLYAEPDGHVYERQKDGWYRRDGQKWERVEPGQKQPQPKPSGPPIQPTQPGARPQPTQPRFTQPGNVSEQLDRERQARVQGASREQQYRTRTPAPAPSRPPVSRPSGGGAPRPHR